MTTLRLICLVFAITARFFNETRGETNDSYSTNALVSEGYIHTAEYNSAGVIKHYTNAFQIIYCGPRWLIRTTLNGYVKGFQYMEVGCTGDEVSTILVRIPQDKFTDSKKRHANDVDANIVPNSSVPIQTGFHIPRIVWLAYGSADYFRMATSNTVIPIFRHDVSLRSLPPQTTRYVSLGHGSLPSKVVFMDNGTNYLLKTKKRRPYPFDSGFVAAEYAVQNSRMVGNMHIPLDFTLKVFTPRKDAISTNDVTLAEEHVGFLTKVEVKTAPVDFRPILPAGMVAAISDYRFRDKGGAFLNFYYLTDRWLTAKETMNTRNYELARSAPLESHSAHSSLPAIAIFAVSAVAIFLVAREIKSGKNKTTNQTYNE